MAVKLFKINVINLLFISLFIAEPAYAESNSTVNNVDSLVTQWVNIQKQNSHLKSQWRDTQRLLRQRIVLLEHEKKQLIALTSNNVKQVDNVTEAREELITLQSSIESQQATLSQWLKSEFIHINNVLPQLPPPLNASWQKTLEELDESELSKKLETLLSLYQKYDEFNQRVSTQQATIIDKNGEEKMVNQLFLGVARGWYLTLDGKSAIAGYPAEDGWQWLSNEPIPAEQIEKAFAMLTHKAEAQLITLPMALSTQPTQGE